MKKALEFPLRILFMILGTIFIFAIPSLIGAGKTLTFHFQPFWEYMKSVISQLTQLNDPATGYLFKQLNAVETYSYSMSILFISIIVVTITGTLFAIMTQMATRMIRNPLKKLIDFFEGVPDLLIIFLFQFFVITLYKETGLKFLQLYGIFGHKPYFVPIVTISFLPVFMLMQFLIKELGQEETKDYVQYSRAKGLHQFPILFVHMLRNIFPLFIIHLRTIIWVLLSNLYLLEFMFNLPGFTKTFMIAMGQGDFRVLLVCLLLFTLPLLIIEAISYLVLKFYKGKESVSL